MTKKDAEILIAGFTEGLKSFTAELGNTQKILRDVIAMIESGVSDDTGQTKKQDSPEVTAPAPEQAVETAKVYTYEEVRAILAEKSRTGFRAEVKALLTAHGVKQLSEITDPEVYAAIVAESEEIGNG